MQYTAQVNGSTKILVTVVAAQELEAGDALRRFKAEVSQDEPRRGNNTNRLFTEFFSFALAFSLLLWYMYVLFFLAMFCTFVQDKVTVFAF